MAAPGGAGPIGPVPPGADPDNYDKTRRRVLWTFPSGLYVVGSRSADGARRNAMTANWVTQVSFEPKLVGVGIEKEALTHELVADRGAFSICTVARDDRAIVRKFTKPVDTQLEGETLTLNGFPFVDGPTTGTPVLDQAAAFIECEVRTPVDCGGHTFFIGEVVNAAFRAAEETEVLRMEDTRMSYGG